MSVSSLKRTPETPAPESVNGARTLARPPRIRRRPLLLVGTIAAVLIGGPGTAWVFTTSAASTEVVAVRAAVQRGEVIEPDDLAVVRVGLDPSLDVVLAGRIDEIPGQRAATDLVQGSLLASGVKQGQIQLWAADTLAPVRQLDGAGLVEAVAFSPDGTLLAAGSSDGTIQIWGTAQ